MVFLWKTIASFRHLKIYKHVAPSPEMYILQDMPPANEMMATDCSQRAIRSSREFQSHVILFEVQRAIEMGKTKKKKNKRTNTRQTAREVEGKSLVNKTC